MRLIGSIALLAILCLSAGLWFSPIFPATAKPTEPWTYDYAEFRNDPYTVGQKTITIYFNHSSYCTLVIYLYNFDNLLQYWTINRYTRSGNLTYSTNHSGIWRLECYMSGYLPYATDETFDLFDLGNPYPDQNNLGTDFTRHPQTEAIRRQAWEIVGDTSSSYEAAYDIYLHVRNNFNFGGLNVYFSIDLQILSDFTSTGQYRGNCQTDSTILTAYARALGIPARVIYLEYWHRWESEGNEHWFTEFCVLNGTEYQWIPVDGCKDYYDWFGIDNANTRLTAIYPYSMGWRRISGPTVCANFTGSGAYGPYIEVSYTGENTYTNNA